MNKMKKFRRGVAALLGMMLVIGAVFAYVSPVKAKETTSGDWMAGVDDEMKLSELSIPGTHDTCTQYVSLGYIFQCQDTSVREQLENGYRYMDMRLVLGEKDDKEVLVMKHNFASCRMGKSPFSSKLYFEKVGEDVINFLEEHPTETVILCMKAENGDDSVKEIQKLLYAFIDKNPEKWYTKNEIPTMEEARGKIVLATRFEDELGVGEERSGLKFDWEDQGDKEVVDVPYGQSMINDNEKLWVQDRFNYDTRDKIEAIVDDMENCQASEDTFSVNFTSTTGSKAVGHPKKYATTINQYLKDYDWQKGTAYGIIVVDFASEDLARCIYETNTLRM